ncbi:MAG: M23 family metallopeptidase [Bacteroidales bacterium]
MSKKKYYKYNEETSEYELVSTSPMRKMWIFTRHLLVGIVIGVGLFLGVDYFMDFPQERLIKQKLEVLDGQYKILESRLESSIDVMEDIRERDDNFYRVMLQADRIPSEQIYAGLDNSMRYSELISLPESGLLIGLTKNIDMLERLIYTQIKSYDELVDLAKEQDDRLDHIPSIQPVPEKWLKRMASGYGYRWDPIYNVRRMHEGMDFAADKGTPVFATGNGTVIKAGWNGGFGRLVVIDHGYNYKTKYAHLNSIDVKVGQKVMRGDKIGEVGSSGKSTGPHLHYEVHLKDRPQNPVHYYFRDLTPEAYNELIERAENAGYMMD